MRQPIHLVRTPDGVHLAWTRCGRGPTLVKAANWMTHLRDDVDSPVWRHWLRFFSDHFDLLRFDERGCGLSDRDVADVSESNWLSDLETVVEAAKPRLPMVLLGISQGGAAAIRYAIKHPERVSHLVLYGSYARGWAKRSENDAQHYHAVSEMVRLGWGSDNPVFRQAFTSRFLPGGTHEQLDWYNELCRKTCAPEMAVRLLAVRALTDISDLLPQVRVPTLVLHARHDEVVPFSEGRTLAANIPGAEFVELESRNHVLLEHEPAWTVFRQALLDFTGIVPGEQPAPGENGLSRREREILHLLGQGLGNAEIAGRLCLSEKTIRNHLSSVYRKLGVRTRAQAIVRGRSAEGVV
jgi:pimeloyl-ACP methyl ester carboxylesterase/DNA-binding CsgD family transcriptional regulator